MTTRFLVTRPYQRLQDGMVPNAVVAYGARPYLQAQGKVIQFERLIYINLWLVQFKVSWLSQMKEPAKPPKEII